MALVHQLLTKIQTFFIRNGWYKIAWPSIERFNESWESRMKVMAELIPSDVHSVVDMGCGPMHLKKYLADRIKYTGVDYVSRDENTIVCDFNNKEFPSEHSDLVFLAGIIEYVKDWEWFFKQVQAAGSQVILSYSCIEDIPDMGERRMNAWKNHLSKEEIVKHFQENEFDLVHESKLNKQIIQHYKRSGE